MSQATSAVPTKVERVAQPPNVDRREMVVTQSLGGIAFTNMAEVMSFAQLMAKSDIAVPKHLRDNPGACMAIIIQSIEWKMSPYAVAGKSYVVSDRISYESQLIHAVIEMRAPLIGRLKNRFIGEGDSRQCVVWAKIKGEEEPLEFCSAHFGKIQPKNSPLWKTKPDLQLYYNASRDWARMYFPDVILGVYAEDEMEPEAATTVIKLQEAARAAAGIPRPVLEHRQPPLDMSQIVEEQIEPSTPQQSTAIAPEQPGPVEGEDGGKDRSSATTGTAAGQSEPTAPAQTETDRQQQSESGSELTQWEGLLIRVRELAEARKIEPAAVKQAVDACAKCLTRAEARKAADLTKERCDQIYGFAEKGEGFFRMLDVS